MPRDHATMTGTKWTHLKKSTVGEVFLGRCSDLENRSCRTGLITLIVMIFTEKNPMEVGSTYTKGKFRSSQCLLAEVSRASLQSRENSHSTH
jgi:hypothetical protein